MRNAFGHLERNPHLFLTALEWALNAVHRLSLQFGDAASGVQGERAHAPSSTSWTNASERPTPQIGVTARPDWSCLGKAHGEGCHESCIAVSVLEKPLPPEGLVEKINQIRIDVRPDAFIAGVSRVLIESSESGFDEPARSPARFLRQSGVGQRSYGLISLRVLAYTFAPGVKAAQTLEKKIGRDGQI